MCEVLKLVVTCPWCKHGGVYADKAADIRVSCQCNSCKKFYRIDFRTFDSIRAKAIKL